MKKKRKNPWTRPPKELEETVCIKCQEKFMSEDRKRVRYCRKCRKLVGGQIQDGLTGDFVSRPERNNKVEILDKDE